VCLFELMQLGGSVDAGVMVALITGWEKGVDVRLADGATRQTTVLRNYKISFGNRPC
jgi:hypothetical protein